MPGLQHASLRGPQLINGCDVCGAHRDLHRDVAPGDRRHSREHHENRHIRCDIGSGGQTVGIRTARCQPRVIGCEALVVYRVALST